METQGVTLSSPIPSDLPESAATALAAPAIILLHADENDIQPLYFIPWIPGIKHDQDAELHLAGLRELTARLLTHALTDVGRAQTPTTLSLDAAILLNRATFGIFDHWRDADRKSSVRLPQR